MITLVAVVGPSGELGANGNLIYSLRDDMRHFKEFTMGHPVIMGRKTFESFPKGPLPGRTNIVVTRNIHYDVPQDVVLATSVEEAIAKAADYPGGESVMIIGGGEIYRQSILLATNLEITRVEVAPANVADTFFPDINHNLWHLINPGAPTMIDSRSSLPYRILHYEKHNLR